MNVDEAVIRELADENGLVRHLGSRVHGGALEAQLCIVRTDRFFSRFPSPEHFACLFTDPFRFPTFEKSARHIALEGLRFLAGLTWPTDVSALQARVLAAMIVLHEIAPYACSDELAVFIEGLDRLGDTFATLAGLRFLAWRLLQVSAAGNPPDFDELALACAMVSAFLGCLGMVRANGRQQGQGGVEQAVREYGNSLGIQEELALSAFVEIKRRHLAAAVASDPWKAALQQIARRAFPQLNDLREWERSTRV